jgi:Domain of unknown function (DUF4376)
MSGNGLTVVPLLDALGGVVGYAAGTAEETALAASQVYEASDPPAQTAVEFLKDFMAARVREVREVAEADGVLIDGNLFETSFEAQVKYLGSLVFATRDPNYSGEWKTVNNGYVTLDALGVYTVCSGIMTYIQNCSVWEQDLLQDIAAATTVTQLQAIDFYAGKPVGSAGLPPPAPGTSEPPPLEAGSVNVADVVAETCTISGLTTSGSITTTGNITCGGAFSTASFALASVDTGAVTATSVTAGSGTISTTGATNTGSLAVSGNATVTGTLGAGATTVASLSAGSGTIATTGATSTGTLTITGTQTSGTYLRSNGTTATLSAIQAADVPTLNQNTTGTASNVTATTNATLTTISSLALPVAQVTGTLPVNKGGTGSATALTQFGVKYASTTAAEATTTAGTTGLPLLANTATGPAFGQLSLTAAVTGALPVGNGGTGATSAAAAITALTGTQTAGTYLRSNGTAAALSAIQAADVPTLNQNTTGTASNVTATTNSTLTTLSALSLPVGQVSGLPAASLSVTSLSTSGNATVGGTLGAGATTVASLNAGSGSISTTGSLSTGAISAAGSVSSTNTEDVFMGLDSAAASRLGFVKKALAAPFIAAGSATDMLFGHFSTANLLGSITSGTFTQRLAISASTGAVTIASALNAASAAISGALTAGATTVASLVATGNATFGGTLDVTGAATAGSLSTTGATSTGTMAATGNVTVGGFLGIGVTNPTSQLDLYNSVSNSDTSFRLAGAGGASATASLLFAPFAARSGGPAAIIRAFDNSYSTDVAILIADSDGGGNTVATERMRIKTSGNVGIGTNNPQARLQVAGSLTVTGLATLSELNVLDQRMFRANIDGTLTSASTVVRVAGTNLYRLGDRPPAEVVVMLSANTAGNVVLVRVFEPIRNVFISASPTVTVGTTPVPLSVPLTGTQYTMDSNTYYTIQIQFSRTSGTGTVTMQAAGFIL